MNKYRVAYLVAVAVWFVLAAMISILYLLRDERVSGVPVTAYSAEEPTEQAKEPVVVQMIPKVEEIAEENTEAVPMERDPVREDIPLDAETQRLLWQACEETGVTYELALAVIWKETTFRNVVGDGGNSFGYMQVQKRWHEDRMERHGVTDLMDPYGNFLVGCDYLAELAAKDRGIQWVLHAYNGGMSYANKLAKAGKVSQYAQNVLNYMTNLGGF